MTPLKDRIDWDTAFICLTWSGLAILAWRAAGALGGLLMLFGPMPITFALTGYFLIKRGDIRATRIALWSVLGVMAAGLGLYLLTTA